MNERDERIEVSVRLYLRKLAVDRTMVEDSGVLNLGTDHYLRNLYIGGRNECSMFEMEE